MSQAIDWSSGWASASGSVPSVNEIETLGTFRNSHLTSKVLTIEIECNQVVCEKSIPLPPGLDLGNLYPDLQQHYKGEPFSIVQDMIDNAWEK